MVLVGRVQRKHMAKVRRHQWRADEGNQWLTSLLLLNYEPKRAHP